MRDSVVKSGIDPCPGIPGFTLGDKPEHDPLNNNNNYIYIFRNIKTSNYVLFLLCVCLIYQS